MASWSEVVASEPDFAASVQLVFDRYKHKTIATLRRDGSPRISGTEAEFKDGELTFGSMPRALKALDLIRDGRFALHSASVDPPEDDPHGWQGDAKISGRASEVGTVEERGFHLFRADIEEVVRVEVVDNRLRIRLWRPDEGLQEWFRD